MSRRLTAWITCLALAGGGLPLPGRAATATTAAAVASAAAGAERGPVVHQRALVAGAGRVVVRFREGSRIAQAGAATAESATGVARVVGARGAATLAARHGLSLSNGRALDARTQVIKASGLGSEALRQALAADADVEWVERDERQFAAGVVPNDPFYASATGNYPAAGQWYLHAPDSTLVSAVNAPAAWALSTGSSSLVVAVLDTGIRADHPDLVGKLLAGYDFISDVPTANDGDGVDSDPADPGDWITAAEANNSSGDFYGCTTLDTSTNRYVAEASTWHGTQVAGIIGANTDNGIGIAGLGRDVMLLPVRVLGKCGGFTSDIVAGMLWAAGISQPGIPDNPNPARVINMSLGGTGSCPVTYQTAINQLTAVKAVVVVAAGNEGLGVDAPGNCSGVLTVAGVRHTGTKVGYSNLGSQVSIAAPAGNCVNTGSNEPCLYPIMTTDNDGAQGPGNNIYSNAYDPISLGTSFSTPIVSGTAALMLSAAPTLSTAQVISLVKSSARSFPSASGVATCHASNGTTAQDECVCTTSTCGAGLLDAGAAVAAAITTASPATAVVSSSTSAPLVGDTVTLGSSGSTGSGGSAITGWAWSITGGTGTAAFSTATNIASPSLVASAAGTVIVKLVVTDAGGHTATASSTLTFSAGLPTAAITGSGTITVGNTTTLSGAGSTAAGSRTITAWLWEVTGGSTAIAISGSSTASTVTISGTAAGSGTVRLTVTDSAGHSASSSVGVTVSAAGSGSGSSSNGSSSSGGGGGTGPLAGLALALAVLALRRRPGGRGR